MHEGGPALPEESRDALTSRQKTALRFNTLVTPTGPRDPAGREPSEPSARARLASGGTWARGVEMGQVQIRCPHSGLWAWTNVERDRDQWESASLAGRELPCGICGERHTASGLDLRIPDWSQSSLASSSAT